MSALCAGRDPEWWSTGDPGNRLAVTICRRCTGCPTNDPAPAGVIRAGVAYTDAGTALAECESCGTPNSVATLCSTCAVPAVPIPKVRRSQHRWIAALARRGLSDEVISAESGLALPSVGRIRRDAKIARAMGPAIGTPRSTPRQKEKAA